MTKKLNQCPNCGKSSFTIIGNNFLKTDKNQIAKGVRLILNSSQDAYEKKVALFDFIKNIEVEGMKPSEEQRVNCLLEGRLYNEISKEKMKEYKKLTAEEFSSESQSEPKKCSLSKETKEMFEEFGKAMVKY